MDHPVHNNIIVYNYIINIVLYIDIILFSRTILRTGSAEVDHAGFDHANDFSVLLNIRLLFIAMYNIYIYYDVTIY